MTKAGRSGAILRRSRFPDRLEDFRVNEPFDLASHTIVLESPRRLTMTSAWTEHIDVGQHDHHRRGA